MEKVIKSQENTPEQIYSQRQKSIEFKSGLGVGGIGLYEQTRKNERFYVGDQWLGSQTKSNLPLVNYNLIKRIGEYKLSQILSNPLTANFCAEGIPNFMTEQKSVQNKNIITELQGGITQSFDSTEENNRINITFSALSDYYDSTNERLKLDSKYAEAAKTAYISGTGALYFYWDDTIDTGLFADTTKKTKIIGDVAVEVLKVEEQLDFENPAQTDVNAQDYIIISKKETLSAVRRKAKLNGISEIDIDKIKTDTSEEYAYEREEKVDDIVKRVTVMTKLFKKYSDDGKTYSIWAVQCTKDVIVKNEWDTGLKRYPISVFAWDERGRCIFGDSEITSLIPNQIAVNRMVTASVWSAMLTGMPILLVDDNILEGEEVTNEPGQIWRVNGENDVSKAAHYLNPPTFSSALMNTSADIMNNTLSTSGATDAALGELRSDNATAIIALREAADAPMQMIKNRYYQFVEDSVRILADIWINYYGQRSLKISDKQGNWYLPFNAKYYKDLVVSVKIDVGASAVWSQAKGQEILDKLFVGGYIDFIQYLSRISKGLITDAQGLIEDYKKRMAQVQEQNVVDEADTDDDSENDIESFSVETFYDKLPPEEQEAFDNMTVEQRMAMIEEAKNSVREEQYANENQG